MANLTAYGFIGLEHLASQRVSAGNVRVVDTAVRTSLEEYNRQVAAALRELAQVTTEHSLRYLLPSGGTLQPMDEWGNPIPVRSEGYFDVAFPIQGGATAWGDNRISRQLMTVAEADRETMSAMQRDADWMRRHMLAAIFDNTSWTYVDKAKGSLTIQPLANNDSVTFLKKSGSTATDNHYYAQAAAIADATNPFDDWYDELNEHPENAGPYVAYIPSNLKASVTGLSDFKETRDANIQYGTNSDQLVGRIDRGLGETVLGYVNGVFVVEWSVLPSNYGFVMARGAATPPLMMREYEAENLRGFFTENFSPDGNLNEYRFLRYAGFGAYNRVGALAFRIGDAAYAIPSGYATPLPA